MTELFRKLTISQMRAALRTLEQSIDSCDEDTWAADHPDAAVNQVVFHTLFFTDLYLCSGVDVFTDQEFHRDNSGCEPN